MIKERQLDILTLRKILDKKGLVDIGYIGFSHTWFNNLNHITAVFERLDSALRNQR